LSIASTTCSAICRGRPSSYSLRTPFAAFASSRWETEGTFPRPTAYSAHTRQIWAPAKACPLCPVCRVCGGKQRRWEGTGCISFRRRPETSERWLPTSQDVSSQLGRGHCSEDGSPIRKIRASRGLGAIPTSLPLEDAPAGSLARAFCRGGQNEKKPRNPLTGSHLLPCPEKLALSPNSGPRPVLRPPGCKASPKPFCDGMGAVERFPDS